MNYEIMATLGLPPKAGAYTALDGVTATGVLWQIPVNGFRFTVMAIGVQVKLAPTAVAPVVTFQRAVDPGQTAEASSAEDIGTVTIPLTSPTPVVNDLYENRLADATNRATEEVGLNPGETILVNLTTRDAAGAFTFYPYVTGWYSVFGPAGRTTVKIGTAATGSLRIVKV